MILKCENCDNEFNSPYSGKKFCSRSCYFEHANKNKTIGKRKKEFYEIRECKVCKTNFRVRKRVKKEMCSDECRVIWGRMDENKIIRMVKTFDAVNIKYGVKSTLELKEVRDKIKETNIIKYGVENPMKNPILKSKLKDKLLLKNKKNIIDKMEKNGIVILDEYTNNKNNRVFTYNVKCTKCDSSFTTSLIASGRVPICRKCNPINKNSRLEIELRDFLSELNIEFKSNDKKVLDGLEIDLLIESHKIGIEVNGNYYHSEINGGKDKNYHINKTILANKKEYDLLHIFEDEWLYKNEIIKSIIKAKLGIFDNVIYARKCVIKKLNTEEYRDFLNNNHRQGYTHSSIKYGLFFNDELVSVIGFGKLRVALGNRKNSSENYELLRFCNKLNTKITGSVSKLLKVFLKSHNPESIISYADLRISSLNHDRVVYSKIGFEYKKITPPNYWYVKIGDFNTREHRFKYRKSELIKEGYDPNKTEKEIMIERNFDRIWDCGNLLFEYKK